MANMFQASGGFLRVKANKKLAELPTVLAQSTTKFRKNLHAVHAQHIGQLDRKAEALFNASIIRRGEKGEGKGGRRETGNFTFGGKGSAFQGRLMEEGSRVGFGWPDIAQADAATNRVWRALEFGLLGKRHHPVALMWADRSSFPQRAHRLPRAFHFEPGGGGPTVDRLVPTAGRYRQAGQRSSRRGMSGREKESTGDMTMGAGIEGKHFLEQAWWDTRITDPNKYKQIVERVWGVLR